MYQALLLRQGVLRLNYQTLLSKSFSSLSTSTLLKSENVISTIPRLCANDVKTTVTALSTKEKLKKAVKEYGTTVIIFHVAISLASLGGFYLLMSNGVEVHKYVAKLGFSDSTMEKFASGTGTFVAAYAVHKLFAPVRISVTLGATPFIVRYLRNKGFLKQVPKS